MRHPTARPKPCLLAVSLSIAMAASSLGLAAQTPAGPGGTGPAAGVTIDDLSSPAVKALMQVREPLDHRQLVEAAAELERVDQLAGGRVAEVKIELARTYNGLGSRDKAIAAARAAIALGTSLDLVAQAYVQLSGALLLGQAPGDERMQAYNAARKAIELADDGAGHLALAAALLRREQAAAAVDEARRSIDLEPTGPAARGARTIVCQNRQEPVGAPEGTGAAAKPEPLRAGGPVSRPEILYRVNPVYPVDLRKKHAQGTVILEAVIDEEGCVTRTKVLRAEETGFAEQAVAAVTRWVFKPATLDGRPVAVYYTLTTNFAIQPDRRP